MSNRMRLLVLISIFSMTAITARGQWVNQTPDTLLRAYRAVFMLDGHTGWIGGAYGSILKTTDGGSSWQLQRSTVSQFDDVSEIRFVNNSTGFCLASVDLSNVLLKTTDGGVTWDIDSTLYMLTADSMVSPTQFSVAGSGDSTVIGVYCWGYFGTPGESRIAIYHSTDLGTTWIRNMAFPVADKNISRILYTAPSAGLLFAQDSVYRTTDGGSSWQADSFSFEPANLIASLRFLNSDTGYFAGPTNGGAFNSPTMFGWTYDGGKTWIIDSTESLNGMLIGSVLFTDCERGFAVKWNTPAIYSTTDGGRTWTEDSLSNGIPPQDIHSGDGITIVAVGAGSEILVSKDSGKTWDDLTPPKKILFSSVKYLSGSLVAAVGNDDGLFVSNDSAKTWTRHQMPSGLNVSIAFGDTLNCWIADDSSRIFHSSDLGLTWTFQNEASVPGPPLYGVDFMNDSIGCAVGAAGFITATTDGGAQWKSSTSGTSHSLYGIFVASPSRAWAVGEAGTILTSSGGFKSWTPQTSPTNVTLRSVSFSDTLDGYILGDNGTILKTTDGGSTWSLAQSPASQLNAMKFVSASEGWVAGDSGRIYNTDDAGVKWTSQPSGVATNLVSLDFLNSETGIAVSSAGIVLTTNNGGEVTGIRPPGGSLPSSIGLEQNYPNPFNPTTDIEFRIVKFGFVTLKVYNVIGQEVATLVNGIKRPGEYTVRFDGGGLASGVYFYTLTAGNFIMTKKALLMK